MTHGQGGSCILSGIGGGGSDVFHWSFFSLKVIASGGHSPPDPPISQLYNVRLSEPLGDIGNKICPILVKQKSFFFRCRPLLLMLSIIITIISARVLAAFYFA